MSYRFKDVRDQDDRRPLLHGQVFDEIVDKLLILHPKAKHVVARVSAHEEQTTDIQTDQRLSALNHGTQANKINVRRKNGVQHKPHVLAKPKFSPGSPATDSGFQLLDPTYLQCEHYVC